MKKLLPIAMFVLLAFAGCQKGPVMYEKSENPRQFVGNVEKFVKQTEKKSRHYSAEDWQVAIGQFVVMGKDYVENCNRLTEEEQLRYDNARVRFTDAVCTNGSEEMAVQVKKIYSELMGQ